ncbi:MAG: sigma-54 dependent transcriptional regulator [Desulfobacterales bacterium]|jgi:DNA-binding NtrC family response regulator
MPFNITIIDDDTIALKRLRRILEKEGYLVAAFSNARRVLDHLEKSACDLVISDVKMPGMNGFDLMTRARNRFPAIEFILITGFANIEDAVHATKEGAFHYLAKPFTPDQLREKVAQALSQCRLKETDLSPPTVDAGRDLPLMIGESPLIRQLKATIGQVAPTDCNVLITGESGTGKELVARLLHGQSLRTDKPFVAFNCASLTESLIANELFGHEKGAFTSAEDSRPGLLEMAHGGTLFMDEIGDIPPAMQVKLLRVLQEKEVLRVGGTHPIPLDVRIVSATAQDLKAAVDEGAMRSDFFFRINVFNIHMPPLRDHRDDIPLLAYHVLHRVRGKGKSRIKAISQEAMAILTHYPFPGNVRELENILERAAAICRDNVIRTSDLPPDLVELELQDYRRPEGNLMTLEELEQDYIAHVLKQTGGFRRRTAEILGIDRASLWRKMKKYGIE